MGKDIAIGLSGIALLILAVFLALHFKIQTGVSVLPTATTTTSKLYIHSNPVFAVRYPLGFSVDESHIYTAMGPGKDIPGVAFIIPQTMSAGTNLSSDSYVSVEWLNGTSCTPTSFLDSASATSAVTDGGVGYQVATSSGAGAGNFYEETVYVQNCTAIRYFIHSTNIANYPTGAVLEYNRAALIAAFDSIRHSYATSTSGLVD